EFRFGIGPLALPPKITAEVEVSACLRRLESDCLAKFSLRLNKLRVTPAGDLIPNLPGQRCAQNHAHVIAVRTQGQRGSTIADRLDRPAVTHVDQIAVVPDRG